MKTKRRSMKSIKLKVGKKAFTLVEIMVVIGIIATVSTLLVGGVALARKTSTETLHRNNAKTIASALDVWYAKNSRYCNPAGDDSDEIGCSNTSSRYFHTIADGRYGLTNNDLQSPCICANSYSSGGGKAIITQDAYYIIPATWNCNTSNSKNHITQGGGISAFNWTYQSWTIW